MKYTLIILALLLLPLLFFAQEKNDIWTVCYDEEEYLMGYENHLGEVMIEPKYMGITHAEKFDKIIAVVEKIGSVGYNQQSQHELILKGKMVAIILLLTINFYLKNIYFVNSLIIFLKKSY